MQNWLMDMIKRYLLALLILAAGVAGAQTCDTLTLPDSVVVCVGSSASITASITSHTTPDSIFWTPGTGLSDSTRLTTTVTPTSSRYYYLTVLSPTTINLVVNGDFSGGDTGFSSAYSYVRPTSSALYPEGVYTITTNPRSVHSGAASFGDHTTGSGGMMVVNGSSSTISVWCQTIRVTPNTYYDFSSWAANWSTPSRSTAPILQFEINGVSIGYRDTLMTASGVWSQFRATWYSGSDTVATICVRDLCTVGGGNDFCLDDITFTQFCTAHDSVYVSIRNYDTTYYRRDTTVCSNSGLTLPVPAGYLSYVWNNSSTGTSLNVSASGNYWVRSTGNCRYRMDTFRTTINTYPSVNLGRDTIICEGYSIRLYSAQPPGNSYLWSTGATSDSIRINTPGLYWLDVTHNGCHTRDSMRMNNKPNPSVSLGRDTTVCSGYILIPNIRPSGLVRYSWTTGATSYTIPVTATGSYGVTIDSNGCFGADTAVITVYPDFRVDLGNDTAICINDSITLQSRYTYSAGATYAWNTGAATPAITTYTTGVYRLSVTVGVCTRTDSIRLSLAPDYAVHLGNDTLYCRAGAVLLQSSDAYGSGTTYLWSNGATSPSLSIDTTGTYSLMVMQNGCRRYDTINIRIVYDSVDILNNDTMICKGGRVQTLVQTREHGATYTYQWLPTAGIAFPNSMQPLITPDTSDVYYFIASTPGCPDVMDSFFVEVQPVPAVFAGGNRFICQFDTLHLSASVRPEWFNRYSYNWSPATNIDNNLAKDVVFTAGGTQKYILSVTTPAGCIGKDSILVTVRPGNFIVATGDTAICPRDSIQMRIGGGASYRWYPGMYVSDTTSGAPWISPATSQHYTVVATSIYGCKDTANMYVQVYPAAVFSMPDSVRIFPGESYHIQPGSNCTHFQWFPPAYLSSDAIADPIASPTSDIRYTVTATTAQGCTTHEAINIFVDPSTVLQLPNAFTPGTGTNGKLFIIKRGDATLDHYRIYNRWGNMMFETTDINEGWDGTYKGTPQPLGVYIYEVEAVTLSGSKVHKQGNVTLLR